MNDNDYIKKAVQLADGWTLESLGKEDPQHISAYGCYLGHLVNTESRNPGFRNLALDALTAQLVRQVDALERWIVDDTSEFTDILDDYNRGQSICVHEGPDRTMNTIKAIVDSGVLAATEQEVSDEPL